MRISHAFFPPFTPVARHPWNLPGHLSCGLTAVNGRLSLNRADNLEPLSPPREKPVLFVRGDKMLILEEVSVVHEVLDSRVHASGMVQSIPILPFGTTSVSHVNDTTQLLSGTYFGVLLSLSTRSFVASSSI